MRGGPPAYKDAHNVTWHYGTAENDDVSVMLVTAGITPVALVIHCGYDDDPTGGGIIVIGGTPWVTLWREPIPVKGPYVFKFPAGIFAHALGQGSRLEVRLVDGGVGITGFLNAMIV